MIERDIIFLTTLSSRTISISYRTLWLLAQVLHAYILRWFLYENFPFLLQLQRFHGEIPGPRIFSFISHARTRTQARNRYNSILFAWEFA